MHRAITILPFAGLLACTAAPHPKPVAHAQPKAAAPVVSTQSPADAIDDATEKAEGALGSGSFARAEAVATQGLELAGAHKELETTTLQVRLLHVLGVSRAMRGDYPGAEQALQRASALRGQVSGTTQADIAFGLLVLGRAQLLECKLDAALATLERAASIDEPLLPATEVDFALTRGLLGEVEEESGHAEAAAKHFERAAAVLGTGEAREPWALVGFLYRLASLQRDAGTVDAAARTLEQAIAISTRFPGRPSEPGLDAVAMYQELARSGAGKFLAAQKINRWRGGAGDSAALTSASGSKKNQGDKRRWDAVRCNAATRASGDAPGHSGTMANSDQVVAGLRQSFRACYNAELKSASDAAGSIRYVAKVGPAGTVLDVRAIAMGLSPDMAECAGERVLAAKFSPPDGGSAKVVIPVTFEVDRGFRLSRLPF